MKRIIVVLSIVTMFGFVCSAFAAPPSTNSKWENVGTDAIQPIGGKAILGASKSVSMTSNDDVTAAQLGSVFVLTGNGTTATLPAVTSAMIGKKVTFVVGDALAKNIDCNASDQIILHGIQQTAGHKVSIGAGNYDKKITFECLDTDGWSTGNAPLEFTNGG